MDLSVIIPVYNGEKHLLTLLNSLHSQSFKKQYEIIVIDNGSEDNTAVIAKNDGAKVIPKQRGCYISAVRNEGAKYAKGEILAFIDADCEAPVNWLLIGYDILYNSHEIGILGGQYTCPTKATWVQKAWNSVRLSGRHDVNFVTSGALFIRSDTFKEFNGFNEEIETGEDYDLCLRVSKKYKIVSDDRLNVIHYGDPDSLIKRLKKEIWYGKNIKQIIKNKPFYLPFWMCIIFGICHVFFITGLVLMNKWILLFSFVTIVLVLAGISYKRCMKVKRFRHFLQLILIYYFYLSGRTISLVLNFFRNNPNPVFGP